MGDSRTKNASRNILFGLINKTTVLLLPFVTRTLLLYLLGTDSVGLSTLFTSVLSFLSLAELGFGQAVVYNMYKPIADNDTKAIGALLRYYRKLYRIIGVIILTIGLCLLPILKYLIKGSETVDVNIRFLYIIYLANTVISYFFSGYRQSLLVAHQRSDVCDKIALVVTLFVRFLEIVVICVTRNIYAYASVAIIGTIITNTLVAITTRKMYPHIMCSGEVSRETILGIQNKLVGLFGTKLNSIVVHQADTMVISSFLGLTLLTQYGNYYIILNAVSGFVMIIFNSMTASIGNKIATDSKENIFRLFERIDLINSWLVGWCSICLCCLYHPFMLLWVKSELTLPIIMSVLMSVYFYIYQIQRTILVFKDAGGVWYEDRYRPYVSMIINVFSNIVLVQIIGIYGVVLSSIIAFLISIPWCNNVVFKSLLNGRAMQNLYKMIKGFAVATLIGVITYSMCFYLPISYLGIVIRGVICLVFPNVIYYLLYRNTDSFIYLQGIVRKILKRSIL